MVKQQLFKVQKGIKYVSLLISMTGRGTLELIIRV